MIEVPLSAFGTLDRPIATVRFAANLEGRFYIDDLRLVRTEFAVPTVVHEAREDATPQHFGLEQNFPNPFNSQTAIRYTLDRAQEVELKVYALTGQHVATLVSGHRSAGRHVLHWDGRDRQGRPLASGMYLYQLRAGGERQTRKLLLVR
ncbi:MAG: T9SS type A sorting domain-containing protein [Candidatus Latescibacteria bacterium]|nr:T9SS type A sorting domain-containing protein [Candidatus Latescibacterota bacterium]